MLAPLLLGACRHEPPPKPGTATDPTTDSTAPAPTPVLVVSSYRNGRVYLFDPATGARIGVVEGVTGAQDVLVGPTGAWVACAELDHRIVLVDPATLAITGALVEDDPDTADDESGGLQNPDGATFGPDGRLYVSSFETDQVLRYEADGTFVDVFVAAGSGGLNGPDIGITFAPNGELLVPGYYSDRVHRYAAATGVSLGDWLGPTDGLAAPRAIVWDAAGDAFVASHDNDAILRLPPGGAWAPFATLNAAAGLAVDEAAGVLFAASDGDDVVNAFDLGTGADQGVRVDIPPLDGTTAIELLTR